MTPKEMVRLECAKIAALALSENETVTPHEVLALTAGLIDLITEKPGAVVYVFPGGEA